MLKTNVNLLPKQNSLRPARAQTYWNCPDGGGLPPSGSNVNDIKVPREGATNKVRAQKYCMEINLPGIPCWHIQEDIIVIGSGSGIERAMIKSHFKEGIFDV